MTSALATNNASLSESDDDNKYTVKPVTLDMIIQHLALFDTSERLIPDQIKLKTWLMQLTYQGHLSSTDRANIENLLIATISDSYEHLLEVINEEEHPTADDIDQIRMKNYLSDINHLSIIEGYAFDDTYGNKQKTLLFAYDLQYTFSAYFALINSNQAIEPRNFYETLCDHIDKFFRITLFYISPEERKRIWKPVLKHLYYIKKSQSKAA